MNYLFLAISTLTSATAQIFLKKGMLKLGNLNVSLSGIFYLIPRFFKNVWLVAGIIFFGTSFLFYLFVLSSGQLNIIYPLSVSFGIILIALSSRFLLKESICLPQISGIIIIILGILLLVIK